MEVIWFLYTVLLTLNFLDYATTHALLEHFRGKVDFGPAPVWKRTRFGKWCVRHGLAKAPEIRDVEWWEHELNPLGRWILKKFDILGLAVLKGVVMGWIAWSVGTNPLLDNLYGWAFLVFMIDLYVLVVANNLGGMVRCRLAPFVRPAK